MEFVLRRGSPTEVYEQGTGGVEQATVRVAFAREGVGWGGGGWGVERSREFRCVWCVSGVDCESG